VEGKGVGQFEKNGATRPGGWRYFALAKAHQGLLAGNREAGHGTIASHLNHPQMRGWYVFDEGGKSGSGGWRLARTEWKSSVAMPHGWAIAEMWLLLRDCLVFENAGRLRLLQGVPRGWFTEGEGMVVRNLPTHHGSLSFAYEPGRSAATLTLSGSASPPNGFVLAVPGSLDARVRAHGKAIPRSERSLFVLPPQTRRATLVWGE
jgi:hypothetical protein